MPIEIEDTALSSLLSNAKKVHFVGIGGVGMSALANLLVKQGYEVSGSDLSSNYYVKQLLTQGVAFYQSHQAQNVEQADLVVISSAIDAHNVELTRALEKNIPIIKRGQLLALLMKPKRGFAIAGTHGKTSTTALAVHLFIHAGLEPNYMIGGKLVSTGKNSDLSSSDLFISETDESDASFLLLQPEYAVITNIDEDHMTTYQNDFEVLKDSFLQFIHNLPQYGKAIICQDCPVLASLKNRVKRQVYSYGFSFDSDFRVLTSHFKDGLNHFSVKRPDNTVIDLQVPLLGVHNVLNATAIVALAYLEGISDEVLQSALLTHQGVGRRLQIYNEFEIEETASKQDNSPINLNTVLLIDDYGHHPNELQATILAVQNAWPNRRFVMAYQPHRFTRTQQLFKEFVQVLAKVPHLILMEIYSAGEQPIQGVSSAALQLAIESLGASPRLAKSETDLYQILKEELQEGDVLLTQGAGSIGLISQKLADHQFKWESLLAI